MKITICNCNSIDKATISVSPGRLNIKHGPNGTGKSTIARAVTLSLEGKGGLSALLPFKYRGARAVETQPTVAFDQPPHSVALFNEEYISQFVFTQDEVLKNSFEVFIKTPQYEQKMAEIDTLVSDIRNTFRSDERIDVVIVDLSELHDCFGKSSKGVAKSSKFSKGLGSGNVIENIPKGLEAYSRYIKSENNIAWLRWQMSGNSFLAISDQCPYCASPVEGKEETILSVEKNYDPKSVEHLCKIRNVIERLGGYFSPETKSKLDKIVHNRDGLRKEEEAFLGEIKRQVEVLISKLQEVKSISFFSLRNCGQIKIEIEKLKIGLDLLSHLKSGATEEIVGEINRALDGVIEKAGLLQGEVNKQNRLIQETAQKHKADINGFLKYAGFKYYVDVAEESNTFKMKLRHFECEEEIENASAHLSYGEKNAFSRVLFMYECLTKNPDLIVLDDPISSFDKNKKYAIIEMLFRSKHCLKNRTVVMLTHDIEPVIDMIRNLSHNFQPRPLAHFLTASDGVVSEKEIKREDILSFSQVCKRNITKSGHDAIKAIYLRRHFEILDDKGAPYQLLSNVFKKRPRPLIRAVNGEGQLIEAELSPEDLADAEAEIRKHIRSFNYAELVNQLADTNLMLQLFGEAKNNYEKLQIFRLISDDNHDNNVVKKFVNETYHIENEYIMQLDPHEFNHVPDHIVAECFAALQSG